MDKPTEQIVTPWKATSNKQFDYDKLITQFKLKPIDQSIIDRIEKLSDKPVNHLLLRNIFYAHTDFDKILDAKAAGKDVYIYTGRGPSADSIHLGHFIPLTFAVYLQQLLNCWVVIQMSDEEKVYFKNTTLDECMNYTSNNIKDIIACGFNPDLTFIFSSFKYEAYTRPLIVKLNNFTTVNTNNNIYGFNENTSVGQMAWPAYQEVPALCGAFPHLFGDRKDVMCLVPCAVDQAPYFRSIRRSAKKLGFMKPALVAAKFLVGLQGAGEKASSTGVVPPIFVNDTDAMIRNKINRLAFSGGQPTLTLHRELGGDTNVDVSYIYLSYFLTDSAELQAIGDTYRSGQMTSGELKRKVIDVLIELVSAHRNKRAAITDDVYRKFLTMSVVDEAREAFDVFYQRYLFIDRC